MDVARAEDKALRGRNLSADPGAETEVRRRDVALAVSLYLGLGTRR